MDHVLGISDDYYLHIREINVIHIDSADGAINSYVWIILGD